MFVVFAVDQTLKKQNYWKSIGFYCKSGPDGSIFDRCSTPTWHQQSIKLAQKSIPRCIRCLIDFGIDFLSIFVRFWMPTWGHVGHIFAQNGARLWAAALFFVGSMLFFDFLVVLAPSWPHFASILEGSGLHFGGFGAPFWKFWGSILDVSGWGWAGRYAKRKEFSISSVVWY